MIILEGEHMGIAGKIFMHQITEKDIYLIDMSGLSLYCARSIAEAKNYIKGYQRQKVTKRSKAYIIGFKDSVHSERVLDDIIAI